MPLTPKTCTHILALRICIILTTFLRDITMTFLSVMDIHTYVHHENRSRIRKLATIAIIRRYILLYITCLCASEGMAFLCGASPPELKPGILMFQERSVRRDGTYHTHSCSDTYTHMRTHTHTLIHTNTHTDPGAAAGPWLPDWRICGDMTTDKMS